MRNQERSSKSFPGLNKSRFWVVDHWQYCQFSTIFFTSYLKGCGVVIGQGAALLHYIVLLRITTLLLTNQGLVNIHHRHVDALAMRALNDGISSTNLARTLVRYHHPRGPTSLTYSHPSLEYDRSLKWSHLVAVDQFEYVFKLLVGFVVSVGNVSISSHWLAVSQLLPAPW